MSDTTSYEQLAQEWARTLNPDPASFTDADYTVSACLADLRYVIANGELPHWYPRDHTADTDHPTKTPVEAFQYDGTHASAHTIATAFGLTIVEHGDGLAALFQVPPGIGFSPGDYYDVDTRQIGIPAGGWVWLDRPYMVIGAEWDQYFHDHFRVVVREDRL